MTIATLPSAARGLVEPKLPPDIEARWFQSREDAVAMAADSEIGWLDMFEADDIVAAITAAPRLKWLNSIYAGVDWMPLDLLRDRGVLVTNGAGINAVTIAEYVVMGMLTMAKGYREVVRAQDRHEWLSASPGKVELAGSKALLLGAGAIGSLIQARLKAFEVEVQVVRRTTKGDGELGPDQWRARLADFDWIILAVPATPATDGLIGAAELAAMKPTARIVNISRGSVIDQPKLVEALTAQRIGGAFLDVTTPEPLPADHPLWGLPDAHITMHLSGRAQSQMFVRGAQRFLENLDRWRRGDPLHHVVDLTLGY